MKVVSLLEEKNVNKIVDPETITKLVLCYYRNIFEYLCQLHRMNVRPELNYINDYIDDDFKHTVVSDRNNTSQIIQKHSKVNVKKHNVIMDLYKNPFIQYIKIDNFLYPIDIEGHNIIGPYIYDKYIVFYNPDNNIQMVFTYLPINYSVYNIDNYKSDIIVRSLNCYVLDNVYNDVFKLFVSDRVINSDNKIDYVKDLLSHNTLAVKISDNKSSQPKKEILRVVKEELRFKNDLVHPFYKWEIILQGQLNKNPYL